MSDPTASTDYRSTLRAAANELARAKRVLVITGAGISADSGLPVYRGEGGLYDGSETDDGVCIEEALSVAMLRRRPEVTWRHLLQIAQACEGKAPNAGHHALAAMERHFPHFNLLTQNVDGLHHAAGSKKLIEIHGDLRELFCETCGYNTPTPAPSALDGPPACPCCAATLRPSIVLFGEALPKKAVADYEAVFEQGVDFVMIVGTSAGFPYIAGPVAQAARAGLPTLEINPARSEVSYLVRHRLPMRAAEALPALWALIEPQRCPAPLPAF
ncbi:MAG: NAD-dependent protein deacylase [Pseudomonadota bacterium]